MTTPARLPGLASSSVLVPSLAPIHTETKVGLSAFIISTSLRPPRMNCLYTSVADAAPVSGLKSSLTSAPGKATLLMKPVVSARRLQVAPVPPPTRWGGLTLLMSIGGGQPLPPAWLNSGMLKSVPIAMASRWA